MDHYHLQLPTASPEAVAVPAWAIATPTHYQVPRTGGSTRKAQRKEQSKLLASQWAFSAQTGVPSSGRGVQSSPASPLQHVVRDHLSHQPGCRKTPHTVKETKEPFLPPAPDLFNTTAPVRGQPLPTCRSLHTANPRNRSGSPIRQPLDTSLHSLPGCCSFLYRSLPLRYNFFFSSCPSCLRRPHCHCIITNPHQEAEEAPWDPIPVSLIPGAIFYSSRTPVTHTQPPPPRLYAWLTRLAPCRYRKRNSRLYLRRCSYSPQILQILERRQVAGFKIHSWPLGTHRRPTFDRSFRKHSPANMNVSCSGMHL